MQRSSVDLPEPTGPEHADDLAAVDLEVDAAQHLEAAEALVHVLELEHRIVAGASSSGPPAPLRRWAVTAGERSARGSPPPRAVRLCSRAISQSTTRASGIVTIRNRIAPRISAGAVEGVGLDVAAGLDDLDARRGR